MESTVELLGALDEVYRPRYLWSVLPLVARLSSPLFQIELEALLENEILLIAAGVLKGLHH